jgi:hypothetical protein
MDMLLARSLFLSAAAGLTTFSAGAADLPSRKSAPVEYVRVCNAYGAGYFYIPGTDTCLRIGAAVMFETRHVAPAIATYSWNPVASTGARRVNTFNRDRYGTAARARVDLDARTATGYGTLRTFLQIESYFGTTLAATGHLGGLAAASATSAAAARETTIVNKAFIQFAGLTAGRAQSMFDFYAGAWSWEHIRGSNATTNLLAYTATFGGGFSATLSIEDETARRSMVGAVNAAGVPLAATAVDVGGTRWPDLVANLRLDQGWGTAQLAGALHNVRASNNAGLNAEKTGWAVMAGLKINLPMLAAGDAIYLEATYEKGAHSYINAQNLTFAEGVSAQRHYGRGAYHLPTTPGLNLPDLDCVIVNGACRQQKGYSLAAAFRHNWTPTLSQAIFGSYMKTKYDGAVLASGIVADWSETRIGTNIVWSPVKNFGIGAEVMYARINQTTTNGALNAFMNANGLKNDSLVETRLRVQRAF